MNEEDEIEKLEDELNEFPYEKKKAWFIYAKLKPLLKAQILREELDKNGLSNVHYEKISHYIKQNVVPQQIREAITDKLSTPIPNILHLCAQEAGWKRIENKEANKS